MTRDEIISMAREAGIQVSPNNSFADDMYISVLYRFATLVAAAEREACASICDAEGLEWDSDDVVAEKNYAAHCAAVIRARGNQ